jgi:hypothetical protein
MDRPMASGTFVDIQGLKAQPDLNGKRAVVVAFASDRERYHVKVGGEALYLKPANLTVTNAGSTSGGDSAHKANRNARCQCGSGKKHKKCCGDGKSNAGIFPLEQWSQSTNHVIKKYKTLSPEE